jgi:Na+(H+)/acetate symporter ActP
MRWSVIFSVIAASIALGIVNLLGLFGDVGWWFGIITSMVLSLILCYFLNNQFFKHGFWTGAISGIINSLIMWYFYDTYIANNASAAEAMTKAPGVDMRSITLYTSPLSAAVGGLIMGVFTLIFGKLLGKAATEEKPLAPPAATTDQTDQTQQS